MVATLSQNDATEDEEESAELSQLSAYEKSLHLITTDDVKLDTDTRQFLMKGFAGKKGKRLLIKGALQRGSEEKTIQITITMKLMTQEHRVMKG